MLVRLVQRKKPPRLVTLFGIVTSVSPVPPKAPLLMLVMVSGMVMLVRFVQPENSERLNTLFPMVTFVTLVQPTNAASPTSATLGGMLMLVRLRHSAKALGPILVTPLGIAVLFRRVQAQNAES